MASRYFLAISSPDNINWLLTWEFLLNSDDIGCLWLCESTSLDDAKESLSALSVSESFEDVSMLSEDEGGVWSLCTLVGLDAVVVLVVEYNIFCLPSISLWVALKLWPLLGDPSWRLAFRWRGIKFLKFGYKIIADAAHRPFNNDLEVSFWINRTFYK